MSGSLLQPSSNKKGSGLSLPAKLLTTVVVLALPVVGFLLWAGFTLPPEPTIEILSDLPAVGQKTAVRVIVREPTHGLASIQVTLAGTALGSESTLLDEQFSPRPMHKPWARVETPERELLVEVGRDKQPALKPGTVIITVRAGRGGTWLLKPPPVEKTLELPVKLDPPALAALSAFIHPSQGGAEVVVYDVGPTSIRDGVEVDGHFFPGFALPGAGPTQRFAFFAAPYDGAYTPDEAASKFLLVATDALGNRASQRFIHKFFPRPMGTDTIELKPSFLEKVNNEIYGRTPELTKKGTPVDDYLQLNGPLRKQNMATLAELAQKSRPSFLWSKTFLPMLNAAVKGSFADRRTYMAEGKNVDTQDHLGFDLASVERAPVTASNDGVVVLARYFGIFGNAVVLDHGYGLMTLYAHMSTIGVKDGDAVTQGQELGRTGATGLAGGDHLHFTTLLQGFPVNPIEWWDAHWIKDRLKLKLNDALPWKDTG